MSCNRHRVIVMSLAILRILIGLTWIDSIYLAALHMHDDNNSINVYMDVIISLMTFITAFADLLFLSNSTISIKGKLNRNA